jgi:phage gpG-like protein
MADIFDEGDKMRRWRAKLTDPSDPLKQIGAMLVSASQRSFKDQGLGQDKWQPRAPINVFGIISDFHAGKKKPPARRFETRPALKDTGALQKSIAFEVTGNTVEVGSNLPYASVHQFGGETESLPITKKVRELMGEWLLKVDDDAVFERLGPLLENKMLGKTLKQTVPARPFVGLTKELIDDVKEVTGAEIMEVR